MKKLTEAQWRGCITAIAQISEVKVTSMNFSKLYKANVTPLQVVLLAERKAIKAVTGGKIDKKALKELQEMKERIKDLRSDMKDQKTKDMIRLLLDGFTTFEAKVKAV